MVHSLRAFGFLVCVTSSDVCWPR